MDLFSLKNAYQFTQCLLRNTVQPIVSQTSSLADSLCFRKIIKNPPILAHTNMECADDTVTKFSIYISELILDRYGYTAVAHVTLRCTALHDLILTKMTCHSLCGYRGFLIIYSNGHTKYTYR